jgi:hypothetical protein
MRQLDDFVAVIVQSAGNMRLRSSVETDEVHLANVYRSLKALFRMRHDEARGVHGNMQVRAVRPVLPVNGCEKAQTGSAGQRAKLPHYQLSHPGAPMCHRRAPGHVSTPYQVSIVNLFV